MIQTINRNQFADAFRSIRPDNFSYNGLNALFNHFEQYEDDTGEQIELDVIAICCDFSEYESIEEAVEQYGVEPYEIENLFDNTTVIEFDGGVIIQDY